MNTETQTKDYQKSVVIKANQLGVFRAITERIDEWWGETDIQPTALDVVFKVSFGEAYWRFRVVDFELNKKVGWECIESNQVHAGLKGIREEWLGTKVHWRLIEHSEGQTKLSFTHEGLVPDFNCYEVCSDAWGFFIGNSLKALVEREQGSPN